MKQSTVNLEQTKQKIIDFILDDLVNTNQINTQDKKLKRKELEESILNKQLITVCRPQEGVTNSLDFNQTSYELYVDLLTTFRFLNDIEKTISKHNEINQSEINGLNAIISKAEDQLHSFEQMLSLQRRPDCIVENFNDSSMTSTDYALYTERYGEEMEASNRASVNVVEKRLALPYLRQNNMIAYDSNVSAANVQLSKQVCGVFSYGTPYGKNTEHIIDTSTQTYWSDTLFTDEPIRVSYASKRPAKPEDLKDYYYGVQHGALFELEFIFESISKINEISLIPYSQFPMDLIAVRYKTTDDADEPLQEVIIPNNKDKRLSGGQLSNPVSFQFEAINCKRLYVICNQIHYVKDTFLVNTLDLFKNDLWFNINTVKSDKDMIKPELIYKPIYDDIYKQHPELKFLDEVKSKSKSIDVKDLILNKDSYEKAMTKYRYQYGFYNVSLNYVEFERTGVFVTKPFEADGTIKSITLKTKEEAGCVAGESLTDIEYYISYGENVGRQWTPILPNGKRIIECERLQLDYDVCTLRFTANEVFHVKRDGQLLIENHDYIVNYSAGDSSNIPQNARYAGRLIESIEIPSYDDTHIYTVRYAPADCHQSLSLMGRFGGDSGSYALPMDMLKLNNRIETFSATGASYYRLEEHPYMGASWFDSNESNTQLTQGKQAKASMLPTTVKLYRRQTGEILIQDDVSVECVTNIRNPEESYRDFDATSNRIQYYTHKNVIYFNQPISEEYDVEVSYRHFISSFQLKAILRNNSKDYGWVTPALSQVRFEIQTAD